MVKQMIQIGMNKTLYKDIDKIVSLQFPEIKVTAENVYNTF